LARNGFVGIVVVVGVHKLVNKERPALGADGEVQVLLSGILLRLLLHLLLLRVLLLRRRHRRRCRSCSAAGGSVAWVA
jgi:hypothetical protein